MPSAQSLKTSSSTLHIELEASGNEFEKRVISAANLAEQIASAGWLVKEAERQRSPRGSRRRLLGRDKPSPGLDPVVLQVHYGSPLTEVLEVSAQLLGSVGGLSLLFYGLKRFWGFDLELKTHREKQRQRFYEAKAQAAKAQLRAATSARLSTRQRKQALMRIDEEMGWERGTAARIEERRSQTAGWDGRSATWLLDE